MRLGLQRDPTVALVFEVDGHRYGVDTACVREIVRAVLPVRLPRAPAVIIGVINVRGEVVPLLDLRLRFALPPRPLSAEDVFVIVATSTRRVALRADHATALVRVPLASLTDMAVSVPRAQLAAGTAVLPDGLLVICDLEAFLDEAEQRALGAALHAYAAGELP